MSLTNCRQVLSSCEIEKFFDSLHETRLQIFNLSYDKDESPSDSRWWKVKNQENSQHLRQLTSKGIADFIPTNIPLMMLQMPNLTSLDLSGNSYFHF